MNILNEAFGDVILLTDFIKQYVSTDHLVLKYVGHVYIYIDKSKLPDKNTFNSEAEISWSDLKELVWIRLVSHSCSLKKPIIIHKEKNSLFTFGCYPLASNILSLFDCKVWKELYKIVGTQLMKYILIDCCLFVDVGNNAYKVLHEERGRRIIRQNLKVEASGLWKRQQLKGKSISTPEERKTGISNKKRKSKCGFEGSKLLNLESFLYMRKRWKQTGFDVDEEAVHNCMLEDILSQDVGISHNIDIKQLGKLQNVVKNFIDRNVCYKDCQIIIRSILRMEFLKYKKNSTSTKNIKKIELGQKEVFTQENENRKDSKKENTGMATLQKTRKKRVKKKKRIEVKPVPMNKVRHYIMSVLKQVIPPKMFGPERRTAIKNLMSTLKYGKHQSFELRELLEGLKVDRIPFLNGISGKAFKWNLLAKLMKWLWSVYMHCIVTSNYYVTERRETFNKLNFYRKKDWMRLCFCSLKYMSRKAFLFELNKKEVLNTIVSFINRKNQMWNTQDIPNGSRTLRLIPRRTFGGRPIILKRKEKKDNSSNKRERLMHAVQTFVGQVGNIDKKSKRFDSLKKFHDRYLEFVEKWNSAGKPKMYFVKMDVNDAFGSIKHKKLKYLIFKTFPSKEFWYKDREKNQVVLKHIKQCTYRKYSCLYQKKDKFFQRTLWRFEEFPSNTPPNCVFIPTDEIEEYSSEILNSIIEKELAENVVSFCGEKFLVTTGAPQGGYLSAGLCNLYYDFFDAQQLSKFRDNEEDFFIRAIDDYLYITSDIERAKKFYELMSAGFEDFNCFIRKEKTVTNFLDTDTKKQEIPFYGFVFNTETMEVAGNFSIYKGINIFDTIRFKERSKPGEFLLNRLTSTVGIKLEYITVNRALNANKTVLLNVLKSSALLAFRFHAIVWNMFRIYDGDFLFECILRCVTVLSNKACRLQGNHDDTNTPREAFKWVAYLAFIKIIEQKRNAIEVYDYILKSLKRNLAIMFQKVSLDVQKQLRQISSYKLSNDFEGTH